MRRRDLFRAAAMTAAILPAAKAQTPKPGIIELRRYYLRNIAENQAQRTSQFLQNGLLPAVQRAGGGPAGVFGAVVAPEAPFLLTVIGWPSVTVWEAAETKMAGDENYQHQLAALDAGAALPYMRMESSLLRCFDSTPAIEVPSQQGRTSPRLFELRRYESNTVGTLARKVKMFNEGEIAIFRKAGMLPVFFGQTILGADQPNLVYLLAYDDMTARERCWKAFGSSPEWQKLRSQPGNADSEIVSDISNSFLQPLSFSMLK